MLDMLDNKEIGDIIDSCPIGMLLVDPAKNITWANSSVSDLLGNRAELILNQPYDQWDDSLRTLVDKNSTAHLPATAYDPEKWFLVNTKELEDSSYMQYLVDITELRSLMEQKISLQDEIKELHAKDDETGLPNSKALFQSLEPQVSRSRRYNNPLTIIILRVNNLEELRQEFGDKSRSIMMSISQMLNDQLRWADIIGRLNDEDFLLVLPETQYDDAINITEKLKDNMAHLYNPDIELDENTVDVEFGIAQWQKGDDVGLLMMRARDMLKQQPADIA